MGLFDFLLGGDDSSSDGGRDWDRSVFDSYRKLVVKFKGQYLKP